MGFAAAFQHSRVSCKWKWLFLLGLVAFYPKKSCFSNLMRLDYFWIPRLCSIIIYNPSCFRPTNFACISIILTRTDTVSEKKIKAQSFAERVFVLLKEKSMFDKLASFRFFFINFHPYLKEHLRLPNWQDRIFQKFWIFIFIGLPLLEENPFHQYPSFISGRYCF